MNKVKKTINVESNAKETFGDFLSMDKKDIASPGMTTAAVGNIMWVYFKITAEIEREILVGAKTVAIFSGLVT